MANVVKIYREMLMGNKKVDPQDKYGFHKYNVTFTNVNGTVETNTTALIEIQRRAREHLLLIGAQYHEEDATDAKLKRVSYPIEEVVEACSYGPTPAFSNHTGFDPKELLTCNRQTDFDPNYDAGYGLCYTFNDQKPPRKSAFAGSRYGLRLILRSEQHEYMELTESAGMRLVMHVQGEEAFVDALGFDAAAGFTTTFSIKFIQTERLGAPYGPCKVGGGTGPKYYRGTYSVEGCTRSCFQTAMMDRCHCADPRFGIVNLPPGKHVCDHTKLDCMLQFGRDSEKADFKKSMTCDCPQICTESSYGVTVGAAVWPAHTYQVPSIPYFKATRRPVDCQNTTHPPGWNPSENRGRMQPCHDWYKQNTVNVEIYWERLNYEVLVEKEAYPMISLVSDFGGQAGLWLGVSVITFVECLSLGLILCIYCCKRQDAYVVEEDEEEEDIGDPYDLQAEKERKLMAGAEARMMRDDD